jgi:Second Messenger Oligonucleotide or Dinucleotide Synthetase domain
MLDIIIKDTVVSVSYNQAELNNIATTLSNLKSIINGQPDYREPFLGGSYKRGTMVKRISDVDVYFRYVGTGNPQSSLVTLKSCLSKSYPSTTIKQDKPSILADFNKIPINITPYKEDALGNLSIPDKYLLNWQSISFGQLEKDIVALRQKNSVFIDLIKVLKMWNKNNNKEIKNFEIEKRVCNLFLTNHVSSYSISDLIYTFFANNGYQTDANNFFSLMKSNSNTTNLKMEWLKFIGENLKLNNS